MKTRPLVLTDRQQIIDIRAGTVTSIHAPVTGIPREFRRLDRDLAPVTNGRLWAIARSAFSPEGTGAFPPDPLPGIACPLGDVGDRLAIKESTAFCATGMDEMTFRWTADDAALDVSPHWVGDQNLVSYYHLVDRSRAAGGGGVGKRIRIAAKQMPKWACRTVLEVTDIHMDRAAGPQGRADDSWEWIVTFKVVSLRTNLNY
jgi:hypothetical protein